MSFAPRPVPLAAAFFVPVASAIVVAWWWLGRPVAMPAGTGDVGKLQCVSYAPFRPGQNPLEPGLRVPAAQNEEDLTRLRTKLRTP